jgi:hypothetical protein
MISLYELSINDEFEKVKRFAATLRADFDKKLSTKTLLRRRNELASMCVALGKLLPGTLNQGSLDRHLWWMEKRLTENMPQACRSDIEDICLRDLPDLQEGFRAWCRKHTDSELVEKLADLVQRGQFDSAIRKAFVILKDRLVKKYKVPSHLDGVQLINRIYGSESQLSSVKNREANRNLLAGLYGVFRNKYGHHDINAPLDEAAAIVSMINYVIRRLKN